MALVLNAVQPGNLRPKARTSPTHPDQLAVKDMGSKPTIASSGTRACALFNQGKCVAKS